MLDQTDVLQFRALFPDEEACRIFLVRLRWPEGPLCRQCGSKNLRVIRTRPEWWSCRGCGAQVSVRAGTVLHGTRRPLFDWLFAMWASAKQEMISACQLQRLLGSDWRTVWAMNHKIRVALAPCPLNEIYGPTGKLGFHEMPISRRALGDPADLPKALVAHVGEAVGIEAPVDEYQLIAVADPAETPTSIAPIVLDELVVTTQPVAISYCYGRWACDGRTDPAFDFRAVTVIERILRTFRGVSRRYLQNYLVEGEWLVFHLEQEMRVFDATVARVIEEPFVARRDMALEAFRRPRRRLAA